ncbi:MAG: hypothetical protein WHS38_11920 [Thermodesulforhabdaceae bacterium]|jgi:hypothetical protein
MRNFRYLLAVMILIFSASSVLSEETKQEDKVTGSVSMSVYNRYIFRGYELSSDSFVVQPSVTVSYKGFSVNYWGNIDSDEHRTQSFIPDREGKKSFNESDFTISYTLAIDKLSLTAGYIYYNTKYADETEELFLSASYDIITKPTLTIYRDISTYPGTYVNLAFSHSFPIYRDITFDLLTSFGYFKGDDSYWRTYDRSTEAYTGEKYNALHDGKIQAGFSIPLIKNLTVQPVIQYWFPLSGKSKRTVDGNSYNPNGHLDDTWVTGITITFSF